MFLKQIIFSFSVGTWVKFSSWVKFISDKMAQASFIEACWIDLQTSWHKQIFMVEAYLRSHDGTAFQYRCHKQMNEAHIHTSSLDIGHTMVQGSAQN